MKRVVLSSAVCGLIFWGVSPAAAVSLDNFTLNGFLDVEYEKADGPGNPAAPVGNENGSFDQVHLNLLMGFTINENLAVKSHIEYEHAPQLEGGGGQGEINIEWSYVEYLVSDALVLRGGIAPTPFGIYNEIHDATPTYLAIRTPWEIYKATSIGGVAMFPKFSTGLFARGRYEADGWPSIEYAAYVANGENNTKNEAENDENRNKAIGGRLMISPISGLTVGGSYYQGEKQTSPTTAEDHIAWAGSLDVLVRNFGLRSEYAASDVANVTQKGWYGETSYAVGKVTPYIRIGTFNPNTGVDDNTWTNAVYGVNVRLQTGLVLKAEWRHVSGESANSKVTQDYNEMAGAITVAF